jgi:hypothetical protein
MIDFENRKKLSNRERKELAKAEKENSKKEGNRRKKLEEDEDKDQEPPSNAQLKNLDLGSLAI